MTLEQYKSDWYLDVKPDQYNRWYNGSMNISSLHDDYFLFHVRMQRGEIIEMARLIEAMTEALAGVHYLGPQLQRLHPHHVRDVVPVGPGETPRDSTRLTTVIDRSDASRTKAPLFAPTPARCPCPAEAWTMIGPSPPANVELGDG